MGFRTVWPLIEVVISWRRYLNLELGLGWYDSEAAAQKADPSLFLRYRNGTVISDSPGPTMIQTFWDFREPNVTTYWLERILRPLIVESQTVDGVLFDDCAGFPNEHADIAKAAGIGPAQVAAIKAATLTALINFTHYIASHGKYSAIYETSCGGTPPGDPRDEMLSRFFYVGTPSNSSASECVSSMEVRPACAVRNGWLRRASRGSDWLYNCNS